METLDKIQKVITDLEQAKKNRKFLENDSLELFFGTPVTSSLETPVSSFGLDKDLTDVIKNTALDITNAMIDDLHQKVEAMAEVSGVEDDEE